MKLLHDCRPHSHITPTDALLNCDGYPGPCCQDIVICPLCCRSLSHPPTRTLVSARLLGPSNFQQRVGAYEILEAIFPRPRRHFFIYNNKWIFQYLSAVLCEDNELWLIKIKTWRECWQLNWVLWNHEILSVCGLRRGREAILQYHSISLNKLTF